MLSRPRILIVDDADAGTWATCLSALEYDLRAVPSFEVFHTVTDWKPNLVLLDPSTCGFELCHRIQEQTGTLRPKVLMLIQFDNLEDIERAVNAGANDFLSKPVNKTELVARIQALLSA